MARRSGTGIVWQRSPARLADALDDWGRGLLDRLATAWRGLADTILGWARTSHPWTNRTHQAESGLMVDVRAQATALTLTLYTTTDHGKWLELRWDGKWGVIVKALQAHYDEAMRTARVAMGGR